MTQEEIEAMSEYELKEDIKYITDRLSWQPKPINAIYLKELLRTLKNEYRKRRGV